MGNSKDTSRPVNTGHQSASCLWQVHWTLRFLPHQGAEGQKTPGTHEKPSLVLIMGPGGHGKTHLTMQYLHKHRADLPGGIFWLISRIEYAMQSILQQPKMDPDATQFIVNLHRRSHESLRGRSRYIGEPPMLFRLINYWSMVRPELSSPAASFISALLGECNLTENLENIHKHIIKFSDFSNGPPELTRPHDYLNGTQKLFSLPFRIRTTKAPIDSIPLSGRLETLALDFLIWENSKAWIMVGDMFSDPVGYPREKTMDEWKASSSQKLARRYSCMGILGRSINQAVLSS